MMDTKRRSILLVEDSSETALMIQAALKAYELVFARSLAEAESAILKQEFSIIVLDIQLPDGSGLDFLPRIVEQCPQTPVIFLTAYSDIENKETAFKVGADDFIGKPFDPKELQLRVEAKIRRSESYGSSTDSLKIGDLVCNVNEQRLWVEREKENEPISLTSLEFRLFMLLAKSKNKVFSRSEILNRIWGAEMNVTDRAVDVHVSNLRKKLAKSSRVTIESVVGSGYRITT